MILVTGALGFVGRHLVEKLISEGESVRVLVPERWHNRLPYPDEVTEKLDVFEGSLFDPTALFRSMNGVHTVIHLASAQWWGRTADLEYVDLQGTQNLIKAARSARLGRLMILSHIGAEPASAYPLMRVKGQVEQAIRNSGLAYTIFRCGILFGKDDRFVNNIAMALRGNWFFFLQPGDGEALLAPLYIDDLTQAIYNGLELMDLVDQTVELVGAEAMTYNEMLRTVMRVSRCQRSLVSLPPYMLRALSSFLRLLPIRAPLTPQWYDILAGNRTADFGNLYNYTQVRPRRFEDTLLTYMPQRRYWFRWVRFLLSRRRRNTL